MDSGKWRHGQQSKRRLFVTRRRNVHPCAFRGSTTWHHGLCLPQGNRVLTTASKSTGCCWQIMEDNPLRSCIRFVAYLPDRVILIFQDCTWFFFFFFCSDECTSRFLFFQQLRVNSIKRLSCTPSDRCHFCFFFFLLIKYIQSKMDHWTVLIHHADDLDGSVTFTVK